MIVFSIKEIEDFVRFLPQRLHSEIFYDFVRPDIDGLTVSLAFLAQIKQNVILIQTKLNFPGVNDKDAIIKKIKETDFGKLEMDITLVRGSIKEIYMSIS